MALYIYYALLFALTIASLGGLAYYLIAISSARRKYLAGLKQSMPKIESPLPKMTLLKPLHGAEPGLGCYLESFYRQDYPDYEILFAVRRQDDPAVAVVESLIEKYPQIASTIVITGEPEYPNAKVYSMQKMAEIARHPILVITDSDSSVPPDYLRDVAATFSRPGVGAMTNLYRGVEGLDFWARLEALGMSSEFMAGVAVAERLEGMKFALGPSMAIHKECLAAIGGFEAMAEYLADDFVLGNWADQKGYKVALSSCVIDHHATTTGFVNTFLHRLRWNRSSRFSRPQGYLGQGFTYGLCWAALCFLVSLEAWSLGLFLTVVFARLWLAWELSRLLNDRRILKNIQFIPLQDLLSFTSWIGAFAGRHVMWRNEKYRLLSGGRFAPLKERRRGRINI